MREFMNLLETMTKDGRTIRVWHEINTDMTDYEHDDEPYWNVFASVDGKTIGSGWFHEDHFGGVHVNDDYRRRGIATALYDHMRDQGYDVRPDPNGQEPDGEAFWAARKKMAESYLDSGRAPLYHWTNPEAARYILEQGKITASLFGVGQVCVTRDRDFHFNKNPVRIDLDGEAVRRNLRVTPFDFSTLKHAGATDVHARHEREERIDGDVPISAITGITIFDNGFIFKNDYWSKQTQALIDNAKRLGIPLTIKEAMVNESAHGSGKKSGGGDA